MKTPSFLRGDGPKFIGIILLVLGIGWWFKILPTLAVCVGVVILFIVAWFAIGYLSLTGRIKPVHDSPDRNLLSDARHPAEWDALEGHCITVFKAGPDDTYRAIMLRFALAINAIEPDQTTLPPGVSSAIMRKMLYEYQRRTGSLYFERFGEQTAISGSEVLRRLSEDERSRFLKFCSSLVSPTNVTPPVVKPDYPTTAEIAQR